MHRYAAYTKANGEVWEVGRIDSTDDPAVSNYEAISVLDIMSAAYRRMAEQEGILSTQAAQTHFRPTPEAVFKQKLHMEVSVGERGSRYYFAFPSGQFLDPEGVAKTSPSRSRLKKLPGIRSLSKPNCFVNDIVTATAGYGIGSILLHAELSDGDFDQDGPVALDVFKGNTQANEWFTKLGFVVQERVKLIPIVIGGDVIPQLRMEAPSLQQVKLNLEAGKPWLATAQLL